MDEILTRLEQAVRRADTEAALALIGLLRSHESALSAMWATVECSLTELDVSSDDRRFQRFAERVRAGFDHDIGQ